MRIQGPPGTAGLSTPSAPRRSGPGGFSPQEPADSRPTAGAAALRTVGGIDALIALQGVPDPRERRRNTVRRGRIALDALDELKIGLLGGKLSETTLSKLRSAADLARDGSGEAGLDAVIDEIELRVAVEIAKLTPR